MFKQTIHISMMDWIRIQSFYWLNFWVCSGEVAIMQSVLLVHVRIYWSMNNIWQYLFFCYLARTSLIEHVKYTLTSTWLNREFSTISNPSCRTVALWTGLSTKIFLESYSSAATLTLNTRPNGRGLQQVLVPPSTEVHVTGTHPN